MDSLVGLTRRHGAALALVIYPWPDQIVRRELDRYRGREVNTTGDGFVATFDGPGRAVGWKASLPFEIDEWAEAVPFKETRGYIQGVVRNRLQYLRLYDEKGNFKPEVGARVVDANPEVRKRRVGEPGHEE